MKGIVVSNEDNSPHLFFQLNQRTTEQRDTEEEVIGDGIDSAGEEEDR